MAEDELPQTPKRLSHLRVRAAPRCDTSKRHLQVHIARESILKERQNQIAMRAKEASLRITKSQEHIEKTIAEKLQGLLDNLAAAQAARSQLIAERSAQGSKTVAKAQWVVQQHRERLSQEREAKKAALQQKLDDAERRRQSCLQQRASPPRKRSRLSTGPSSFLRPTEVHHQAARRIQQTWRAWRRHRCMATAKAFSAVCSGSIASLPYKSSHEKAALIASKPVLAAVGPLLVLCGIVDLSEQLDAQQEANCRKFLSHFMFAGTPGEVLQMNNELEVRLSQEATSIFQIFLDWFERATLGDASDSEQLLAQWRSYAVAFDEWKKQDSAAMVQVMIAQFVELDMIWQSIRDKTVAEVSKEYHDGIRKNQTMLLAQLRRIVGDQVRPMIGEAIKKARATRHSRTERTIAPADLGLLILDFLSLYRRNCIPSNRQLVHEVALDNLYRIPEAPKETPQSIKMKAAFHKSMVENLANGKCPKWLLNVVQECRDRILGFFKPDAPSFATVSQAFDMSLIENQCEHDCFDYLEFIHLTVSSMAQLCAPTRDVAVAAIQQIEGSSQGEIFVKRIDAVLTLLDQMHLDFANYHLGQSTKLLLPQATLCEQQMFDADVRAGKILLAPTTLWLKQERRILIGKFGSAIENDIEAWAVARVFVTDMVIPDTFAIDLERVRHFRKQSYDIIQVVTLLATVRGRTQQLARLSAASRAEMKSRLMILVSAHADSLAIACEVNRHFDMALQGRESDSIRTQRRTVLRKLVQSCDPTSSVWNLFMSRVLEQVARCIKHSQNCIDADLSALALTEVADELREMCATAVKVAACHLLCYGGLYERLLKSPDGDL
jgi:hypothetical protein